MGGSFLGVSLFWWGVGAAYLVPQLWHNRDDVADFFMKRNGGRSWANVFHILFGKKRIKPPPPPVV